MVAELEKDFAWAHDLAFLRELLFRFDPLRAYRREFETIEPCPATVPRGSRMEDPEVEEIPVSASTLIDGSDQTGTGGTSERSGAVRPVKGRKGRVARSSSIDGALNPGNVPPTIRLKLGRPRWFNQSFLVFMALRQAGTPLPRGELIRRALELDKKIGAERGLPPCFTGKVWF